MAFKSYWCVNVSKIFLYKQAKGLKLANTSKLRLYKNTIENLYFYCMATSDWSVLKYYLLSADLVTWCQKKYEHKHIPQTV